jgi:ribosomal protein S4E
MVIVRESLGLANIAKEAIRIIKSRLTALFDVIADSQSG